jgi:hypothetical protein
MINVITSNDLLDLLEKHYNFSRSAFYSIKEEDGERKIETLVPRDFIISWLTEAFSAEIYTKIISNTSLRFRDSEVTSKTSGGMYYCSNRFSDNKFDQYNYVDLGNMLASIYTAGTASKDCIHTIIHSIDSTGGSEKYEVSVKEKFIIKDEKNPVPKDNDKIVFNNYNEVLRYRPVVEDKAICEFLSLPVNIEKAESSDFLRLDKYYKMYFYE